MMHLHNVNLQLPGVAVPILKNINYHIAAEDFVVILGSNGSGKSSLLKCLNRQYQTTGGEIRLQDKAIQHYAENVFSRKLKTLTQNCDDSLFLSLTVLENYLLVQQTYEPNLFAWREAQARECCGEYLKKFNPNLPAKLDQVVAALSGGEKQALVLAFTMLYPPQVLLLDEHTSALDPKAAAHLMDLTRDLAMLHKITCVLTTHDLALAEKYGNRILALRQGEILQQIECGAKEKFNQESLLAACY